MSSARVVLESVTQRLAGVTETPRFEAELLLTHALGWTRTQLFTRMRDPLPELDSDRLESLLRRRIAHEPMAYILGAWEFFSLEVAVEAPLLVPRPETEHLVEAALAHLPSAGGRVLDLCTGTGCVALAIAANAQPDQVWASDLNPVAVRVATENARRHDKNIRVVQGDLFNALPDDSGPFDVIVSNPPYVEKSAWDGLAPDIRNYEDPGALLSGEDGLDCIRRIVGEAPRWLVSGGLLALEMGEGQGTAVLALLDASGFDAIGLTNDLAGHNRIAHGIWA